MQTRNAFRTLAIQIQRTVMNDDVTDYMFTQRSLYFVAVLLLFNPAWVGFGFIWLVWPCEDESRETEYTIQMCRKVSLFWDYWDILHV